MDIAVFTDAADNFRHLRTVFIHDGTHVVDKNRFDPVCTSVTQMYQFQFHMRSKARVLLLHLRR